MGKKEVFVGLMKVGPYHYVWDNGENVTSALPWDTAIDHSVFYPSIPCISSNPLLKETSCGQAKAVVCETEANRNIFLAFLI